MKHLYPIVTTVLVQECRDFYVKALDARVLFETEWYVHLSVDGWEIGFLRPNPPVRLPVFSHATLSRGLCLAVEVEDVRKLCEQLQTKGIQLLGQLEQFASGELAFSVVDPAGVVLNIVERQADARATFEL